MTAPDFAAVVLCGGQARRMRGVADGDGADKTRALVGGRPLLDRVLDATSAATQVVVVGPRRPVSRQVMWTVEEPPGGGPAAAVAAALPLLAAPVAVLLAGDLPFVRATDVASLVDRVHDDGAVVVDTEGREQWLCSAWRTDALRSAVLAAGGSLHRALRPLRFAVVPTSPGDAAPSFDCDTPEDLRRARELA